VKETFLSSLFQGLKWGATLAFFGGSFLWPVGGHVAVPVLAFPGFLCLAYLLLQVFREGKIEGEAKRKEV